MSNEEIDRILKKGFNWKIYWNKPLVIITLLLSLILFGLGFLPIVELSETARIFCIMGAGALLLIEILVIDLYFFRGIITTILMVILSIAVPNNSDLPKISQVCHYTRIEMEPALMRKFRSYIIDRFIRPKVNKENSRWMKIRFKNNNLYKYDKKKEILWIYHHNSNKKMLAIAYRGIFEDLRKWEPKHTKMKI